MKRGLLLCVLACLGLGSAAWGQNYPGTEVYLLRFADPDSLLLDPASLRNLSARPGYDNQPSFTPDGRALLYSSERNGQTDIMRVDLETGTQTPVRETPESEFSPVVLPDGSGIAVVRIEADSTQRLWRFPADSSAAVPILPEVRGVGYQCWVDAHRVALFILGQPHALYLGDVREGGTRHLAENIGRSLGVVPGKSAVSFVQLEGAAAWIREIDPAGGEIRTLAPVIPGSEDYAWTPTGRLLMAQGLVLTAWNPQESGNWEVVLALGGAVPGKISRLAVSPDGTLLALVVEEPAAKP